MIRALQVIEATRRFGDLVALDRVSFDVSAGEVLALLGENGAGKSTLVEMLGGTIRLNGGSVLLDGQAYAPRDPREARRAGVAVVHQHFQLVESFTVAENLRLAVGSWSLDRISSNWKKLERRLGHELPHLQAPVSGLGVGARQWLEIGKALLVDPRVLLLDEPTAVLTPKEADRLFSVVQSLRTDGVAVVFITHRLDEVERIADRVVVLRRGRATAHLDAAASAEELAAAMVGRINPPQARHRPDPGQVVLRAQGLAAPPRLSAVDLEIRSGEVIVLAGVDGNGQVDLAERIAGLLDGPGSVEVAGMAEGSRGRLRPGVAVVPGDRQRQGLMPSMSVAENLAVGTSAGRFLVEPAQILSQGRKTVEAFAVAGRPEQRVATLSGGNQQKIVVARALLMKPRVLVAIHPTRGLDVAAQLAIRDRLVEAAAEGSAVLVVSADLDEALEIGDRILVFSHGRIVGEGGPDTGIEVLARWVGGDAA